MKKAGVCGHFGFGRSLLNGQTVKTKNVTDELKKYFGDAQVAVADSCGGIKAMPRMAIDVLKLFKGCENIIMMPANRGLRVFAPLFLFYNKLYHRKIHYVVIGGCPDPGVLRQTGLRLRSVRGAVLRQQLLQRGTVQRRR